jgi:hypothetical protein
MDKAESLRRRRIPDFLCSATIVGRGDRTTITASETIEAVCAMSLVN